MAAVTAGPPLPPSEDAPPLATSPKETPRNQAWDDGPATNGKLQLLEDAAEMPRFVFQLPMSSYGTAMIIPLLVDQPTLSTWLHYSGMTYVRLIINYVLQISLVAVLFRLWRWGDIEIQDANEAGSGCFKLLPLLYVLCLWLHSAAVLMDVKESFNMLEIVMNKIPTVQGKSEILRFEKTDSGPVLRSGGMSQTRKLAVSAFVILPKLAIAGCVLFFGGFYLGTSPGNPDLILNSLAVVFVMDVDEMVSAFLAPNRIVRLLESVPAWECDSQPWYWNVYQDFSTIFYLFMSVWVIVVIMFAHSDLCEISWPGWSAYWV